jgi:hypothetical protein
MPFSQPIPRSFSVRSIREYAPQLSGVYGLSNASEWIYIGESDNIQESLLVHFQEPNRSFHQQPTGFVYEICERGGRHRRQDRLVLEYEPSSNRGAPSTAGRRRSRQLPGVV